MRDVPAWAILAGIGALIFIALPPKDHWSRLTRIAFAIVGGPIALLAAALFMAIYGSEPTAAAVKWTMTHIVCPVQKFRYCGGAPLPVETTSAAPPLPSTSAPPPASTPSPRHRAYEATMRTFQSYVCMAIVNHYAGKLGATGDTTAYADMITDAPQATEAKTIAFMRPDRTVACGKITYKQSQPSLANSYRANADLYKLSEINAEAFDSIKIRIRDEAFRVAKEFVRPKGVIDPHSHLTFIKQIAEEYRQDIEDRLNRSGIRQNKVIADAQALSIPEATGPDIVKIRDQITDAADSYETFIAGLHGRRDVGHSGT